RRGRLAGQPRNRQHGQQHRQPRGCVTERPDAAHCRPCAATAGSDAGRHERGELVTSLLAEESMGAAPRSALSVSVVIPTRDRPEMLRRAVASVLDQEYGGAIEVVVVQDRPDPDAPEPTFPID